MMNEESLSKVRATFHAYDLDGTGSLNREELKEILDRLGSFDALELDTMLTEIDKNGNGEVELDEFLDYINAPNSPLAVTGGEIVMFDLEAALRPLFNVYDTDGSEKISLKEFKQCHEILVGALNALPPEDDVKISILAVGDATRIFDAVDTDDDQALSIQEFVEWQRDLIENSGITRERLLELVQTLASLLQTVSMLHTVKRKPGRQDSTFEAFQKKVLGVSKELWKAHGRKSSKRGSIPHLMPGQHQMWTQFPEELKTESLVQFHMRSAPMLTKDVIGMKVTVGICVPEVEAERTGKVHAKRWFAKIIRHVTFSRKSRKRPEEHLYFYAFEDKEWLDAEEKEFYEVYSQLPEEMRLLALFVTEADFGNKMTWEQIQNALRFAESHALLEAEDIMTYAVGMEKVVIQAVIQEGKDERVRQQESRKALASELVSKVELSPVQVMASLSDMHLVQPHPLWSSKA